MTFVSNSSSASYPTKVLRGGPDHSLMLRAVKEAGACALSRFNTKQKVWKKSKHHSVCEADIEVNKMLHKQLIGERPNYGWLSEESELTKERFKHERIWIVDPIDGTNSYLKGIPEFAISVALVENGVPLTGAVYNPARDQMFEAVQGHGTYLNNKKVSVTLENKLSKMKILSSRSEYNEVGWPKVFESRNVYAMSSIAYKLALVSVGNYDAAVSAWPKADWDICAGSLLISEAGGCITSIDGNAFTYNKEKPIHQTCLASNRPLHPILMKKLKSWA